MIEPLGLLTFPRMRLNPPHRGMKFGCPLPLCWLMMLAFNAGAVFESSRKALKSFHAGVGSSMYIIFTRINPSSRSLESRETYIRPVIDSCIRLSVVSSILLYKYHIAATRPTRVLNGGAVFTSPARESNSDNA